ncbi:hypothetical protein GCM10011412_01350 [Maribacter cobaltidurans]|nr:hypothetical protein GCM10011412_01350 [Maribacter cobaltidurans]
MFNFGTSDEPVTGHYNPILEQLAEQYCPIREPVVYQHHPNNGQAVDSHRPTSGQALVSTINNTKQVNNIKQPKGWQAVINFFIEKGFNADEGKKFFEHYETRNWQTSDGNEIRDWRALATNWMDRTELYAEENKPNKKQASQIKDNLRTTKNKDYGQPL